MNQTPSQRRLASMLLLFALCADPQLFEEIIDTIDEARESPRHGRRSELEGEA